MPATPDQRHALVELYDRALPEVFGYLASRCGSASVAEDLTSETFLAAVDAVRRGTVPDLTVARPTLEDVYLKMIGDQS